MKNGVARWSRDSFWHAQPCRLGILRQLIPPVAIKWSWNCPLSGLWQYIEQSGNSDRWSQQLSVLLRRSYVAFSVSRAARLTADFGDGDEWDDPWPIAGWSNCHFPFVRRNTFWNESFLLKLKKKFSLLARSKFIFVRERGTILAHSWFIVTIFYDVSQNIYRQRILWYRGRLTWKTSASIV